MQCSEQGGHAGFEGRRSSVISSNHLFGRQLVTVMANDGRRSSGLTLSCASDGMVNGACERRGCARLVHGAATCARA